MKIQVQTKRLGSGLFGEDGWEVWFEGYRIPKQEREWIAEMRREREVDVRVVNASEKGWIGAR
jgi:hypothetical protein